MDHMHTHMHTHTHMHMHMHTHTHTHTHMHMHMHMHMHHTCMHHGVGERGARVRVRDVGGVRVEGREMALGARAFLLSLR